MFDSELQAETKKSISSTFDLKCSVSKFVHRTVNESATRWPKPAFQICNNIKVGLFIFEQRWCNIYDKMIRSFLKILSWTDSTPQSSETELRDFWKIESNVRHATWCQKNSNSLWSRPTMVVGNSWQQKQLKQNNACNKNYEDWPGDDNDRTPRKDLKFTKIPKLLKANV